MNKIKTITHERASTCATHGDYTERGGSFFEGKTMWFGCSACNAAANQAEAAASKLAEEKAKQARLEARLQMAGIPAAFRDRSFANYVVETDDMRNALEVVRDFSDNFWSSHNKAGTFLVLNGARGTGKSHLAIAATPAVMARGTAMYVRAADLIRRVRDTWRSKGGESETDVLRMFGNELDLLIIDEIGVQRGTDDEQMILFDILDRRYSELRPTILLTNLTGKSFCDFLGPRIIDRLRERAIHVPFKWESWRGRKPAEVENLADYRKTA